MSWFARRRGRKLVLFLLIVHVPGARVHARTEACGRTHVYHGPARPFKALARAVSEKVTHVARQKRAPRSFGASRNRSSSLEVCSLKFAAKVAPVTLRPDFDVTLALRSSRPHPDAAQPLPVGLSPSPPLHTRK